MQSLKKPTHTERLLPVARLAMTFGPPMLINLYLNIKRHCINHHKSAQQDHLLWLSILLDDTANPLLSQVQFIFTSAVYLLYIFLHYRGRKK